MSDNDNRNSNGSSIDTDHQIQPDEATNLLLSGLDNRTTNSATNSASSSSESQTNHHRQLLFGECGPAAGGISFIVEQVIQSDIMEDITTFEEVPEEVLVQEVEEQHQLATERSSETHPPHHHEHRHSLLMGFEENPLVRTISEIFQPQQGGQVVEPDESDPAEDHTNDEASTPGATMSTETATQRLESEPLHDIDENRIAAEDPIIDDDDDEDDDDNEPQLTYPEEQVIESHYTSSPEKLGVIPLAVLVFYNVSGGPFGIETTVRAGGSFYALLGFLVMPFCWSLQEALLTAELGSTFVEASGGVAWVEEAFGPGAGWIAGYLGWIAGATDNAIYPVLFCDYVLAVMGGNNDGRDIDGTSQQKLDPTLRFVLLSMTSIILAYVNWRGLPMVGKMSVAICVISMSPFIIMMLVGAFKVDPSRWFERPVQDTDSIVSGMDDDIAGGLFPAAALGGILWRPYLNNLFWNLNSFDAAGSLVAELDDLKLFLRAMMLGVFLVVTFYFFPLLIAIGASDAEQTDWTSGYLAAVNSEIVGPWLGVWTIIAAGISNIALFQAELSSDAFQLMGMADRGHLPKIFSKRSRHGTPTYGIILGTAVIVVMGASDLDTLIEMLNFNYAVALLMEYAAFFKLRISRPELERPYRIPLNTFGCVIFFLPAIACTVAVMLLATYTTITFAIGSYITGLAVFYCKNKSKVQRPPTTSYELVEETSDATSEVAAVSTSHPLT